MRALRPFVPVLIGLFLFTGCTSLVGPHSEESSANSSSSSDASMSDSNGSGKVDPTDEFSFTIQQPHDTFLKDKFSTGEKTVEIKGINTGNLEKFVVVYDPEYGDKRDEDVYEVKGFKKGDTTWRYIASEKNGNLRQGINRYTLRMFLPGGQRYLEQILWINHYNIGSDRQSQAVQGNPLSIEWTTPQEFSGTAFLKQIGEYDRSIQKLQMRSDFFGEKHTDTSTNDAKLDASMRYSRVGTVRGGDLDGGKVLIAEIDDCMEEFEGPCFSFRLPERYVQKTDGSFVRFTPSQNVWFQTKLDTAHRIDLMTPQSIKAPEGKGSLRFIAEDSTTSLQEEKKIFVSQETGRGIYEGERGCLLMKATDGTTAVYDVDLSEYRDTSGNMTIAWKDGTKTTEPYMADTYRGCNFKKYCLDIAPHVTNAGGSLHFERTDRFLEEAGSFSDGKPVYREVYSAQQIKNIEKGVGDLGQVYSMLPRWEGSAALPSPEEFYKSYPVIYVEDPLGRFVRLQKEKFQTGAECGKPVIYLYPEKEQDIHVQVDPVGGLTVSDPPYHDGWLVRATPEGVLYNYANRATYPYLFWEGDGGNFTQPPEGFVVERNRVHSFMLTTLATLGLNDKESQDFLEFWEPKLTVAPWVFITFVPQKMFDAMAPLTISPAPDTVIRVFMDFAPLNGPMSVKPLPLLQPERSGFTVVEWGGVLHAGDKDILGGQCIAQLR